MDYTESIDLQAFDSAGNCFSSLTGLPFKWHIDDENLLKPITFGEAMLDVSAFYFENQQRGTDRLPVLGSNPGKALVTVALRDPGRTIETSVSIIVTEPLRLQPPTIRICPLQEFTFSLETKRKLHG